MANRYIAAFAIVYMSVTSCGRPEHSANYSVKDILGLWELSSKGREDYPTLSFEIDSTAVFTSIGDTVYRWKYLLLGDSLVLVNIYNTRKVIKISHLDSAKLIFNGLLDRKGKQLYLKSNRNVRYFPS